MSRYRFLALTAFLLFLVPSFAYSQGGPPKDFDAYVEKALKDWGVPGIGVAIVKDDAVVMAKGYGVRKVGESTPVDERTMFAIGSSSKAFTAAALAVLVDEGKIDWDDAATKHLKDFQLHDPYVTRELTVRDLLTHRCGLVRGDGLWHGTGITREEILHRVRFLKPTWSFRSQFGYQNLMYLAAGQIVPAVTGKSWDDFVRERIFFPLGMSDSNTSVTALESMKNVATPHAKIEDEIKPINWRNIDNIGPAGSINSSALDMCQWLRMNLKKGEFNGKRLLSTRAIGEMQTSQTIIRGGTASPTPKAHFKTYGMGWFMHDYHGKKIVEHGGAIDGMRAIVAMIPEENLGMVALCNRSGSILPVALMYQIFDSYLGVEETDWSEKLRPKERKPEDDEKETDGESARDDDGRVKGTKPSLDLKEYTGTFKDDFYGEVKVKMEDGKLVFHQDAGHIGTLEHWHFDTFEVQWQDAVFGKPKLTFTLNSEGKVDTLKMGGDRTYERTGPAEEAEAVALSEEDLKKFAGTYEMTSPAQLTITIELVGKDLKATIPGQPEYTLTPVGKTRFEIKGAPVRIAAEFELEGDRVKSLKLEQGSRPAVTFQRKE